MRRIFFCSLYYLLSTIYYPSFSWSQEIRVLLEYLKNPPTGLDIGPAGLVVSGNPGKIALSTRTAISIDGGSILVSTATKKLFWKGKPYKGRLEVRRVAGGRAALIHALDVEEYLYRVLPNEMDATSWPIEALKAQAVASRSYALYKIGSNPGEFFDVGTKSNHQVYAWLSELDLQAKSAVDQTKAQVLLDDQRAVVPGYFHSCCGGRTEDARDIWSGTGVRSLVSVSDFGACRTSPHYSWVTTLPAADLEAAFKRLGYQFQPPIKAFLLGDLTPSRRVISFKAITGRERLDVPADKLRQVMGPNWIKSTFVTQIARKDNRFVIYGRGWGHGVGLCQWGARGMADKRMDYKKILKRYFPKAAVSTIEES
ncbi:MAG: SpoIID/LytB domain-containing protein [Elusimicrobia bacterium]|nr:SpoIID/LytB domain-containing protein [Elusimicrobiota bacterium]